MARERAKDTLHRLGVRPRRERGQNFVISDVVLDAARDFGRPSAEEYLVEIGPGLGALTAMLMPLGLRAVVEVEAAFCKELARRYPTLRIENADAREFDLATFGAPVTIFSNLPYRISTDMVMALIRQRTVVKRAVLLLQREFAERCAAAPGGRDYGALSIAVQLWAQTQLGPVIPGDAFHPPTSVESQFIELRMRAQPLCDIGDEVFFRRVIQGAFHQRRRKLPNSLAASGFGDVEAMRELCRRNEISPDRRAETLSIAEFVRLSNALRLPR